MILTGNLRAIVKDDAGHTFLDIPAVAVTIADTFTRAEPLPGYGSITALYLRQPEGTDAE